MIVFEVPVAAYVVLVPAANAKDLSLIRNQSPTKLWDDEVIVQLYQITRALVHIVEVDVLGAPFEVMDVLARAVALLQDECVLQELLELRVHVHIRVIGGAAGELPHLALFHHELF